MDPRYSYKKYEFLVQELAPGEGYSFSEAGHSETSPVNDYFPILWMIGGELIWKEMKLK